MPTKRGLLSLLLAASVHICPGICQSPGPDWPNCATGPQIRYGGWEFYRLGYQPPMNGRADALDATLEIDAQNDADGSRTICSLRVTPTGASANVTLDSRAGGCETGWGSKYAAFTNQTRRAPAAVVTFDAGKRLLSINQTWTCREGTQIVTSVGTASGIIDLQCFNGREGERTSCHATGLNSVLGPPVFLGPVTITRSPAPQSTSAIPTQAAAPQCRALQHKWQLLYMSFTPPGTQPQSPSYWPTSVSVELRNLDDGSRTRCALGADNVTNYEQGILLHNDGAALQVVPENKSRTQGCLTGWWYDKLPTATDPSEQEWRWSDPADVSFNTKTHVLSISQTYRCVGSGVHSVTSGTAAQELKLDCKESGNKYYPLTCEPTDALYSSSSAPVILAGA